MSDRNDAFVGGDDDGTESRLDDVLGFRPPDTATGSDDAGHDEEISAPQPGPCGDAQMKQHRSKKLARNRDAWRRLEQTKESGGAVTGSVVERVKGGLIVDVGVRGFLPASLVELRPVRDLEPYIGRHIEAKVIELDENRGSVVLSRQAQLEQRRDEILAQVKSGDVRRGVVSSVASLGAFVDLGGIEGLLHVSELSWTHVEDPGSVLRVGDEIDVQVLEVDRDEKRISLSLKATQQDPWLEFAGSHRVGDVVYGRVIKLVPFGAFVQLGQGIRGLVHHSEMRAGNAELPKKVLTRGEELWVRIIDVDVQSRRISLSVKGL